jgi:hypothetical protein
MCLKVVKSSDERFLNPPTMKLCEGANRNADRYADGHIHTVNGRKGQNGFSV